MHHNNKYLSLRRIPLNTKYLSIRRTPSANHAAKCLSFDVPHKTLSATSFAEPKLSELVPTLTGESNFASWSTALKYALDTRDPYLFEIPTGHIPQPGSEDPSLIDNKPKHFYTFHQRKAGQTLEECFQNPANAKLSLLTRSLPLKAYHSQCSS
ncbi:hypothetical protein N7516_003111 [Penicillium verrucosum]|uniref:uncharacterized protein n=1 Tax=Penicillium verrucosum TaxID=60171 RepID=UPI0025454747|nr:uncharacterized protein N7516_003111 [Penicillium verrucosum]KAJ5942943.1 hypothetical protein N7516_003111 [Penicillium verrucosum]